MRTLGVTGGIGSGKTLVCRMLEELGARVFNADREGKRILVEYPEARAEIIEAFGAQSYDLGGSLNRKYLADRVFSDPEQVKRINRIVHPRVFERFEREKERAAKDGVDLLVKEAALIFETDDQQNLDEVIVVDAPRELRIRRVMERDGVTREQVLARMKHQLPAEELRRRADLVLENDGSVEKLRADVESLYRRIINGVQK